MLVGHQRTALVFSLLLVLLGLHAGCTNMPGLLGWVKAAPSPAATDPPGDSDSESSAPTDIEGQVGNATATPSL